APDMALLHDLFGYLAIIIHGVVITAQSVAIGGVVFLVFLARPRAWLLGDVGAAVLRDAVRLAAWGALVLALAEAARSALGGGVLAGTTALDPPGGLTAEFAVAGLAKIAAALLLPLLLAALGARLPAVIQLVLAMALLAPATATTHAAARLDDRPL